MHDDAALIHDALSSLSCLGSWQIDYAAERIRYTGQLRSIFGLLPTVTPESVPFSRTDHIFYKEDLEAVQRFRKSPLSIVGGLRTVQFRVVDADGCFRWIESRGHVAVDRYGQLTHGHGVMFEVTAQHAAPVRSDATTPALAELDALAAKLIQACRIAKSAGLLGIEAELRPTLAKVVGLLGTKIRATLLH